MSDDEDDNVFFLPIFPFDFLFTLTKAVGQKIKKLPFVNSNAIKLSASSADTISSFSIGSFKLVL